MLILIIQNLNHVYVNVSPLATLLSCCVVFLIPKVNNKYGWSH